MKIIIVRSGGFGGIERRGEGDTDADPGLRELVEQIDLDALPRSGAQPDRFVYEIEIGGRSAEIGESDLTGPIRALVDHVLG